MVRKSEATLVAEEVIRKAKKRDRKNSSRKLGRNFKYYGTTHSQTLYRSRGQREKNKARRAAKRERRLSRLRERRNGIHQQDYGTG